MLAIYAHVPHSRFAYKGLWQDEKTYFFISLPSSKLAIYPVSIYKQYTIDIADPSSMREACHMNFVIDLAHRGVFVSQW